MRMCKSGRHVAGLWSIMYSQNSKFRQQAVTTANLLLLESLQGSSVQGRSLPRSDSSPYQISPTQENNALAPQLGPSVSTELRSLFNWSTLGKGKPSKRQKQSPSGPSKKKPKKSQTWAHSWVCLSGTGDDLVPDATERVSLKMAGLGECCFPVDVSATAQELCYALEVSHRVEGLNCCALRKAAPESWLLFLWWIHCRLPEGRCS
jgi:hypothetical protein